MPSPGGQFFSQVDGDIEDYFISDYELIDQYIGDQLWVWGRSTTGGTLGINATTNRNTPVTTILGGTSWVSVGSGANHVTAIKTDGTLWTWGNNADGNLGTNNSIDRSTPVTTILGGNNWKRISNGCGGNHTAAIKTDGTLWLWGRNVDNSGNSCGQLGINSSVRRSTPVTTILGGTDWKQVSCGQNHTAAVKTDGTLWTWGLNREVSGTGSGQLGVNDTNNRSTPVTTSLGGTNWKQVACGYHTAAIKTDGTLWTWGVGGAGQLGNNRAINISVPVTTFIGGSNWKQLDCGHNHVAAIKTDGTLWIWGRGDLGALGNNRSANIITPITTILGGNNWKQVACGQNHTVAIKTDGTLWLWGYNVDGRLGIGNTVDRSTPVTTFLGGNNWKSVKGGYGGTFAVTSGLNVDLS